MTVKVTNNAFGTISAGISSSDTTVTLDTGQGARFPTLGSGEYFYGTLIDTSNNVEVIKVTARSTDSMTVTRAQDNTTARAFAIGDRFELRPVAKLFEDIQTEALIDNSVPDQSSHSGKFLTTDGTNVSWATAGTDASDLTTGTLPIGRMPNGTLVKVTRGYGTTQVSPTMSGSGRNVQTLLSLTHTPVASGNRLILHATAGFNSNSSESSKGAFGIFFEISGAGSGNINPGDFGNYPWYDPSLEYPSYPPDTSIHWNDATTGSGNVTVVLSGYAYNESTGTMTVNFRRYALTIMEVAE